MNPPKSFQLAPIWPPGFKPKFDSVRIVRIGDSTRQFGPAAKYGGSDGGAGLIDLDALKRAGLNAREESERLLKAHQAAEARELPRA